VRKRAPLPGAARAATAIDVIHQPLRGAAI
jgi:hypothetical protein